MKIAIVLPIVQVVAAEALLQWGYRAACPVEGVACVPTPALICRGLNAPARMFLVFDPTMWGATWNWLSGEVFDFGSGVFLVGVAVVWYLVGRALDRRRDATPGEQRPWTTVIVHLFLLASGGLLAFAGVHDLTYPVNNLNPVGPLLTLTWSAAFVSISGRRLMMMALGYPRRPV